MNHDPLQWLSSRLALCGSFGLLLLSFACAAAQAGSEALDYEEQPLTVEGESRWVRVPKGYRLEWLRSAG